MRPYRHIVIHVFQKSAVWLGKYQTAIREVQREGQQKVDRNVSALCHTTSLVLQNM